MNHEKLIQEKLIQIRKVMTNVRFAHNGKLLQIQSQITY